VKSYQSPWASEKKSANTSVSIFVDKEFDDRRNSYHEPIMYSRELLNDNGEELQFEESRLRFAMKAEAIVKKAERQSSDLPEEKEEESKVPEQNAAEVRLNTTPSEPPSDAESVHIGESDKENDCPALPPENLPPVFDHLKEDPISDSETVRHSIDRTKHMNVFEIIKGPGAVIQDFGTDSSSEKPAVSEPQQIENIVSTIEPLNETNVPTAIPDDVLALSPFSKEFKDGVVKARAVSNWCQFIQSRFSGEHMANIPSASIEARISMAEQPSESSLSSILNKYTSRGKKVDEVLAVYYAIEILECMNICTTASVVHGSITSDSFTLRYGKDEEEWPEWEPSSSACEHNSSWTTRGLTLSGFNDTTAVDASFVHPEQCAHRELPSSLSMISNPEQLLWAVDSLSVAAVLHQVVFDGASLAVKTDNKGRLCPSKAVRHTWASRNLWCELFDTLLNWRDDATDPIHIKPPYAELCKKFESFLSGEQKRLRALKMQLLRQQMS